MKKIIRNVDEEKGIVQVTVADERWYMKPSRNQETGLPEYKSVPSVTWIAGCYPKGIGYYKWLANLGWDEAEAVKNAAGDKGTKVHLAIEAIFRGEEVRYDSKFLNKSKDIPEELTDDECKAIESFVEWKNLVKPEVIAWEVTVWSDKYNYAGTVDLICKIGDDYYIVDFKTSKEVHEAHMIQVNMYRKCIENGENSVVFDNKQINVSNLKMAILQVGYTKNREKKDGTQTMYKFTEIVRDDEGVDIAKRIWQKEHGDEKPSKRSFPIVLSPALKVEDVIKVESKKAVKVK